MSKRRTISLVVMGLLAVVAVVSFFFVFNNAGKNKNSSALPTISVDRDQIVLELEVEEDPNTDNDLRIVDNAARYGYLNITVGGLPSGADKSVLLDNSSDINGVLTCERVGGVDQSTGRNRFLLTAQNGGQVNLVFTTIGENAATIKVSVKVNLTAKYVTLKRDAHFGVIQGNQLDFNSSTSLDRFNFYAHEKDVNQYRYKPTAPYAMSYELKEACPDITLVDGVLSVGAGAETDQEIFVLARLPEMETPIEIPVYIFAPMGEILVSSDAFMADNSGYDLILNRDDKNKAIFNFASSLGGEAGEDYDFIVKSQNSSIVSVDVASNDTSSRSFYASQNLGETIVKVTMYPSAIMTINGEPNQKVWFNAENDADVQVSTNVLVRVRNEFKDSAELGDPEGQLVFSVDELDAFYYDGDVTNPYSQNFTIDTWNSLLINYYNDIEFELEVEDLNNTGYAGVYTKDSSPQGVTLDDILDIRVWNDTLGKWVSIWEMGGTAYYHSQFSIAMYRNSTVYNLLASNLSFKLRVKSVSPLSTSTSGETKYARTSIPLSVTVAIDDFAVQGLNELGEIALVYHKNLPSNSITIALQGIVSGYEDEDELVDWNMDKVTTNATQLPFKVDVVIDRDKKTLYYTFGNPSADVEYYRNYPITFSYPNGVSRTINIKVYPYAQTLNMKMTSENGGYIYETIYDPNNPEYIRTVYVRAGATYKISVDTPGVSVGAATDLVFTAGEEGLYKATVSLSAYSNDVFMGREREFEIFIVVINPIKTITFHDTEVTFPGIGAEWEVSINVELLQETKNVYSNLQMVQTLFSDNVSVEKDYTSFSSFKLRANYLMGDKERDTIGFTFYKYFNFNEDLNGDGRIDENDTYLMLYNTGLPIRVSVAVENSNPVRGLLLKDAATNDDCEYLTVISNTNEATKINVVVTPENARKSDLGIAFAKWTNGQFEIDFDLDIKEILSAKLDGNQITITPVANQTSMGEYALVVYALDSLRLVDGEEVPGTYVIKAFYVGTEDAINETIKNITLVAHDANSGLRNKAGGFNWIVKGEESNTYEAILFYTEPNKDGNTYPSDFEPNRYFLDDLQTVLGWPALSGTKFSLTKKVTGKSDEVITFNDVSYSKGFSKDGYGRLYFEIDEAGNDTKVVEYTLQSTSGSIQTMSFYAVPGIDSFEVSVVNTRDYNNPGLVARKNLSPDGTDLTEFERTISMQRGIYFAFGTNIGDYAGWKVPAADTSDSNNLSYTGGKYEFVPYIEIGNTRFTVTGLKAQVKVTTYGGIDYLNILQSSATIDGSTGAIYDVTLKTDRSWEPALLNYWFVYNYASYPLFQETVGERVVTYIPMEGGSAGFMWELTCENPKAQQADNGYYTYYLKIKVSVIIESTAVDPFRNVNNAQLILRENLDGDSLVKEPVEKSTYLSLLVSTVKNVSFRHFANTITDKETGDISIPSNQTDTNNIYIDQNISGGVLRVYPTPYYNTVDSIDLVSSEYIMQVVVGKDFQGKDILDEVKYSIGFTQLVYNESTKTYQTFLSGSSYKMVSSWSPEEGYKWDGVYYFKTFIKYDGYTSQSLSDGTKFTITVRVKSDNYTFSESMDLYAKYENGITVEPLPGDGTGSSVPVNTMTQTRYQALGTTAVYDIAFPTNYVPKYTAYTVEGNGADYATRITVDAVAKTLTVEMSANPAAINKEIEVKIPYKAQGDFVNPYLSVVIVPVYFEVESLEVYGHPESPINITGNDTTASLKLRVVAKYNTALQSVDIASKLAAFNSELNNSELVRRYNDGVSDLTINITYSYVNGVATLVQNGDIMYEQVFKYELNSGNAPQRMVYQAIGLTQQYDLDINNKTNLSRAVVEANGVNGEPWNVNVQDGKIDVQLDYNTNLIGKTLTIKIYSIFSNTIPEFTLVVQPTYFTFSGYKLKNYPVNPLIALSTPFTVELEADNVEYYEGTAEAIINNQKKVAAFNEQLSAATNLRFSSIAGDALNFTYNNATKELTRIGEIMATSYLKVESDIKYVNGIPTLVADGMLISSLFTVKTYGSTIQPENPDDGNTPGVAPSTRTLQAAQGIGLTQSYSIAVANVLYDSTLDLKEKIGTKLVEHTANSGWNAVLKGNQVVVTLDGNEELFGRILVINVYSQENSSVPAYTLNIVPAWFTVNSYEVLDHPERPIWIIAPETTDDLHFDVNATYADISGVDIEAKIAQFRDELNSSSYVVRSANAGVLTIITALSFIEGQPNFVSIADSSAVLVQSSYSYEKYTVAPGPITRTEAQVIGTEGNYLLSISKTIEDIKALQYNESTQTWEEISSNAGWSARHDNNHRVYVTLDNSTSLINKQLKVEVYSGGNLLLTLKIVPAYFVVSQLAVDGQNSQDLWIITPQTPADLTFVAVVNDTRTGYDASAKVAEFNQSLKETSDLTRIYDHDVWSGNLLVTLYIKYENGVPVIISPSEESDFKVRIDSSFNYTIYADAQYVPSYPSIPDSPRTRTENQAIGLEKRYKIDLPNGGLITTNMPSGDHWRVAWEGDDLIVSLDPDLSLLNETIVINLYTAFEPGTPAFVLTIKPVIFEVVGFEVVGHPEQPLALNSADELANLQYRGVIKYSDQVSGIKNLIADFNYYMKNINTNDTKFFQVTTTDDKYLTVRALFTYTMGQTPQLAPIDNDPVNVVQTTFEYKIGASSTNAATYVQAIGTTKRYTLDLTNGTPKDTTISPSSNLVTAKLDGEQVVIELAAQESLSNTTTPIKVNIYNENNSLIFTLNITPVLFEVEGFDVVGHPERYMWVISPEKIAELQLRAKATYSTAPGLQATLEYQLNKFNTSLNKDWVAYLEKTTTRGEYFTVSGAINYEKGIPSVVDPATVALTKVVSSTFQYKMYSNGNQIIGGDGIIYPDKPKSAIKAQAIGLTVKYNVDLPDLTSYSFINIKLYEEVEGVETRWTSLENNGWDINIANNQIEVQLLPDASLLIGKRLKIYIYYTIDNPNPAFILNIDPVYFTVKGLAIKGQPQQPILVDNISDVNNFYYIAVADYSKDVPEVLAALKDFNDDLNDYKDGLGVQVSIDPPPVTVDGKYYLTGTISVAYSYLSGNAILQNSPINKGEIWTTFEVIVKGNEGNVKQQINAVQAIGTTKIYQIDLPGDLTLTLGDTYLGNGYKAEVITDNKVAITLDPTSALINSEIVFGSDQGTFTMHITPVLFEVLGFEIVNHPERPVWIIAPSSTDALVYRAYTSEVPSGLDVDVESAIAAFNTSLNNNRNILLSERVVNNQYIILRAAIDYNNGIPEMVKMDPNDTRNVVEEIIEFQVWADSKVPDPTHPPVMGTKYANQVIGSSATYNFSNVNGKFYYQYMWVEGAGDLVSAFNTTRLTYAGVDITCNASNNQISVQLAANPSYLNKTITIYIPYLVTINYQDVWYSYALEIKPILFEVYGWSITPAPNANTKPFGAQVGNFIYLNEPINTSYIVRFKALVNKPQDANLQDLIETEIAKLENSLNDNIIYLMRFEMSSNNPSRNFEFEISAFGEGILYQRSVDTQNDSLYLMANVVYGQDGMPTVVPFGTGTEVKSQVEIYTGEMPEPWPPEKALMMGGETIVQAIGTTMSITVNIANAEKIMAPQIDNIVIDDESGLVEIIYDAPDADDDDEEENNLDQHSISFSVKLAPNMALLSSSLEIKIPYTVMEDGKAVQYNYIIQLVPVLYQVEGFRLVGYPENVVDLSTRDIKVELELVATRSEDALIRNAIDLAITALQDEVNTAIRNGNLQTGFDLSNNNSQNARVVFLGGNMYLQKLGNINAANDFWLSMGFEYKLGIPTFTIPTTVSKFVTIRVNTTTEETLFFPGIANITQGANMYQQTAQAIGTSKSYQIKTGNANQTFYLDFIEVRNAGPMRGLRQYEYINIEWTGGSDVGVITVTMKADAKLLIKPVEICIPYTEIVDGQVEWHYYSLSIQPVLFEVLGWGLQQGNDIVNEIVLADFPLELYFKVKYLSAPMDTDENQVFSSDDLYFLKQSIRLLEEQVNEYDERISDKFQYMIIHNVSADGYQTNYTIYHDDETDKTFIESSIPDASITIMELSANVSYDINAFGVDIVDSAKAVVALDQSGQTINGSVSILTTDRTIPDESTAIIMQENAYLLGELQANTNYILMSDIYLSKIAGYESGWRPAAFPSGSTLDGNNFKIYIDGFDLSNKPSNIGLFTTIPNGAVIKNVQVVVPSADLFSINYATTVTVDLQNYQSATVNIGLLAGTNNGIITNCAVLSEWQFMQNVYSVNNPITNGAFGNNLKFNLDGYLFDDDYFYETQIVNNQIKVTKVYNNRGYLLKYALNQDGQWEWVEDLDRYGNNTEWITPDKTNIARYDDYSAMMNDGSAPAKLLVTNTNATLGIVLGGLVGSNNYMITNSRVLIDVELYGPETTTNEDEVNEATASSAIVGGVVGDNSGTITSSYFRDANVINNAYVGPMRDNPKCYLGGFVGYNETKGIIMSSYAMGYSLDREKNINFTSSYGKVQTIRNLLGGFAHQNDGTIKDCLVNMVIDKTGEGTVGGFVQKNSTGATITNCIENNVVVPHGTLEYYTVFVALNDTMTTPGKDVKETGLSNLKYAGERQYTHDLMNVLTRLTDVYESGSEAAEGEKYSVIDNYDGFSIGQGDGNNDWGISAENTIWQMTDLGPALRAANDIAVSYKKSQWLNSDYLYNPGTAKNPILIWDKAQFRKYIYEATPQATEADKNKVEQDVELNRQGNNLRMVDNITLDTVPDTYKITYTGVFDGNGLKMDGINLPSVSGTNASIGLFGKLEYATIRNVTFGLTSGGINAYGMRYVGGLAGVSINTNFVDVTMDSTGSATVIGGNIVGGLVGVAVITDSSVEVYNVTSNVSATSRRNPGATGPGDSLFSSGLEYYQQTLYAINEQTKLEQAYGAAGGVFGFVTSNPNNYKDANGKVVARAYEGITNQDAGIFLKDKAGNKIEDNSAYGLKYYTNPITLRQIGGSVKTVTGNVVGGLIGIMDETVELRDSKLTGLQSLVGKYYLGGLVGINLGKISGGSVEITTFNASSVATNNYVYRASESAYNPIRYWGMTVGAVAAYNDGVPGNDESGLIENLKVSVNMLGSNAKYIYVIGGVVGVNGDNGMINSVVNDKYVTSMVLINTTQLQSVGYYFGNIVGRGNVNVDSATGEIKSFSGFEDTKLDLVQKPVTGVGQQYFVSPTDFATPNFLINGVAVNAFGVEKWRNAFGEEVTTAPYSGTAKVQTLTLDEYMKYLAYTASTQNVVERIKALEIYFRTLPTEPVVVTLAGNMVAAERVQPAYMEEFLNWIKVNKVFENGISTVLQERLYDNYLKYIQYTAYDETKEFFENDEALEEAKQERYALALEYFTYISHTSGAASGSQNAYLTWEQYLDYIYFRDHAKESDTLQDDKNKYPQAPEKWVYPTDEFVEYRVDSYTQEATIIEVRNNTDYLALLSEGYSAFSTSDPLQAYINFIIPYTNTDGVVHSYAFTRGEESSQWQMTLAQYYYFIKNILPNQYGSDNYVYTAEEYADYLFINFQINQKGGTMLTLDEYITFVHNEQEMVVKYEKEWIQTGHIVAGQVVSDIGGVTLGWAPVMDEDVNGKVKDDGSVIYYEEDTGVTHKWEAVSQYQLAKQVRGLTITKYSEIRRLGGSLYALLRSEKYDRDDGADLYIFELSVPQYGWSADQINFIQKAYSLSNIKYAISATYYGNVLDYSIENMRSILSDDDAPVYISSISYAGTNGERPWKDVDGDKLFYINTDEVLPFHFERNQTYTDQNDRVYSSTKSIYLGAYTDSNGTSYGQALYIDDNYDQEFTWTEDLKDYLVLYEVGKDDDPDFNREVTEKDSDYDPTVPADQRIKYYKISRYITQSSERHNIAKLVDEYGLPKSDDDPTKNHTDYLEESLWWFYQGFSATEFDQIKHHAMRGSYEDSTINILLPEVYTQNGCIVSRTQGYILADDWCVMGNDGQAGFGCEGFTTNEYVDIVLGASTEVKNYTYSQDDKTGEITGIKENGTLTRWYSNYLRYQVFQQMYNGNDLGDNLGGVTSTYQGFYDTLDTDIVENPQGLKDVINNLVEENILADAISFSGNIKSAYLAFARAGGTLGEYVAWAWNNKLTADANGDITTKQIAFFRPNHYIYACRNNIDLASAGDFVWALQTSNRININYEGCTEEAKTTDLLAYRTDWYNNGNPFITTRDYYEWINVFAYSEAYKTERGDLTDGTAASDGSGWLTIDAYAVWKRMEKYQNNNVYIAKSGSASGVTQITAPILNRKISTTIFPKIYDSGKPAVDSNGVEVAGTKRTLPSAFADSGADALAKSFYGWGGTSIPDGQQRPYKDRYEYNENYVEISIDGGGYVEKEKTETLISEKTGYLDCDSSCGGWGHAYTQCTDPTHAAYQVRQWELRYGAFYSKSDSTKVALNWIDWSTVKNWDVDNLSSGKYAQLYIPYEIFEQAAKTIMRTYDAETYYAGYHNFMKYWAKNGEWNQIGNTSGLSLGSEFQQIQYTYLSKTWWDNYDGTQSPVNGQMIVGNANGSGWVQAQKKQA